MITIDKDDNILKVFLIPNNEIPNGKFTKISIGTTRFNKFELKGGELNFMEPQTADPAADGADVVVETPVSETEVIEETPVANSEESNTPVV